jgi:hypothetical protein
MKGIRRKRSTVSAILFVMALLALLLSLALPALADVPPGASDVEEAEDLDPIWIFDEEGELLKFEIADNDVRGYSKGNVPIEMTIDGERYPDGELTLDEVIAFRAVHLGIFQLWPEDIPDRENLAVAWTNPSPGMEGIMEYITACVSRDAYDIDVPAGTSVDELALESYSFGFANIEESEEEDGEEEDEEDTEFETQVLEEVFPKDFFELRSEILLFQASVQEDNRYREEWEEVRELFLTEDADALFEVEEEEESVPVWPLIFSLSLLFAVAGTTIYGVARGKE